MWSCLFLFVCESIAICKGGRLGPRSSVDKNILSTHTRHPITPYIRILIADRRWYDDNAIRWGHSSVSIALHCHCSMRKKSRAASIAFATIEMDQIERMNADATQHLLWVICQFSWFDFIIIMYFSTHTWSGAELNRLCLFAYFVLWRRRTVHRSQKIFCPTHTLNKNTLSRLL